MLVDLDVDAELVEGLMKARIEVGDGDAAGQVERSGAAVVGANEQRVVDEVDRPSQPARSFGRSWLFRIPRVSATPRPFS